MRNHQAVIAPALATARNKRINIRQTIKNHTKLAELEILNQTTRDKQPIDAAALKLMHDSDDTHMYVNELMKSNENEQKDKTTKISGYPHRKGQGTKKNIRPYNDE